MRQVKIAVPACSFALLALVLCVPQAQAQITGMEEKFEPPWENIFLDPVDDNDGPNEGIGFGKRIAGTWMGMGSFDLDFDCDGVVDLPLAIPALDLHTIGVGGSYLVTTAANPNSIHGTWEQTGPRQLTSEAIGFGSDPNCVDSTEPPDGVCDSFGPLASIFSIKTVLDFDEDYQNASTSFGATVHPPTEDPLDPDAVVNLCTVGSHYSFKKVNALW
jgi:hypothetical protein